MAPTGSAFVTSLGDFSTFATDFGSPMFILGESLVSFVLGYDYVMGKIDTVHLLYFATVMGLLIELCAAAYIIVKTTDATISFVKGYAF